MEYEEEIRIMDKTKYREMWETAERYNELLFRSKCGEDVSKSNMPKYMETLMVTEDGMMGHLIIPKIECDIPVYHGTDAIILQKGAGHIETTSLPVGGINTNCVISGHTGLHSAKLFTDLEKMEEGDLFYLVVLGETLSYEVDQIVVVLPSDTTPLDIIPGEDHCSLLTCTPYGINSHRLIVRGSRIETTEEMKEVVRKTEEKEIRYEKTFKMQIIFAVAGVILTILNVYLLALFKKRKKQETKER